MFKYMKHVAIILCLATLLSVFSSCTPMGEDLDTQASTEATADTQSQAPSDTVEGESASKETDASTEDVTKDEQTTQTEVETQAEIEVEPDTQAATEDATHAPNEDSTNAPAEVTTNAPAEVTTNAPAEVTTNAPAEVTTNAPAEVTTNAPAEVTTNAPAEVTTNAPAEVTTNAPVVDNPPDPSAYRVVDSAYSTMYSTADVGTLHLYIPYRNQAEYKDWNHKVTFSMNSGINYIYEEGFIALDRTVESVVFGYAYNGGDIAWSEGDSTFCRADLTADESALFDQMNAASAYAYTGCTAVNLGILFSIFQRGDNKVQFVAKINGTDIITLNEYTLTITETLIATPTTEWRYHGCIDSINGTPTPDFFGYKDNGTKKVHVGVMDSFNLNSTTISLKGWSMINGGQQDYFWSVDGNIWHSFDSAVLTDAGSDVINAVTTGSAQLTSTVAANGRFDNMKADLSAYAGMNVTFRLAVRSASDVSNGINNTLCHIMTINNLHVGGDRGDLVVISYNVKTENGAAQSGVSTSWDTRVAMLKEFVNRYMPDSIGMQEVTSTWRSYMDSQVFDSSVYAGVGVARTTDESKGLEQCAIYYRKDKYRLIDSGTFWLSDTPDVVGSKYDECEYPRICTYVVLQNKTTDEKYIHMNTHLAHEGGDTGRQLRAKQIGVMFNKLYELGTDIPVVITGDFNQRKTTSAGNNYAVYKLMVGLKSFKLPNGTSYTFKNLADSRLNADNSMTAATIATMTKYYNTSYNPINEPIDYCFYSSDTLEALSYFTVLSANSAGEYMSDHLPVITRFKFK